MLRRPAALLDKAVRFLRLGWLRVRHQYPVHTVTTGRPSLRVISARSRSSAIGTGRDTSRRRKRPASPAPACTATSAIGAACAPGAYTSQYDRLRLRSRGGLRLRCIRGLPLSCIALGMQPGSASIAAGLGHNDSPAGVASPLEHVALNAFGLRVATGRSCRRRHRKTNGSRSSGWPPGASVVRRAHERQAAQRAAAGTQPTTGSLLRGLRVAAGERSLNRRNSRRLPGRSRLSGGARRCTRRVRRLQVRRGKL